MSGRANQWTKATSVELDDGEEQMRDAMLVEGDWGWNIGYLIGPSRVQSDKIADVLKRAGELPDATDNYALEEGLMRGMAGKELEAKACVKGLGKKFQDQVVRRKPHMAVGAIYTKANQINMHMNLLTQVGGNPGDDWQQVADLGKFTGSVVKAVTRSKSLMPEHEAVLWIKRYQAARQGLSTETAGRVLTEWAAHKAAMEPTEKRKAALSQEKERKRKATDADLVVQEPAKGAAKRIVDFMKGLKK